MQDFYLKFESEAQAKSVLYTQQINEYTLTEAVDPLTLEALGQLELLGDELVVVEHEGNFYKLVEGVWNQLSDITYLETPKYRNTDIIGAIYQDTGEVETDSEGNEVPVMEAIEGFHVNVRALGDEEDITLLEQYSVEVSSPVRVWA
jgi:hypothetical protein